MSIRSVPPILFAIPSFDYTFFFEILKIDIFSTENKSKKKIGYESVCV